MNKTVSASHALVIFDGECNFCNASVNFILDKESKQELLFTSNGSNLGKLILSDHGISSEAINALFFYEKGRFHHSSTAALRIAAYLRFPWNLLIIFLIVPAFIRDGVYRWIANNRYKWWGRSENCRVPTESEKGRILS